MSYVYILHKYAQDDYEASLKWYLERSEQAAVNFVEAVEDAFRLICENPERWNNKYKNFFEFRLKKYPFTIVYTIEKEDGLVFISAIYHNKRNPKKKYRKL